MKVSLVVLFAFVLLGTGGQTVDRHVQVPFGETDHGFDRVDESTCSKPGPAITTPTSNVNIIAGDAYVVKSKSNPGCISPQNEPSLAENPANPLNLVAGANDYRTCCNSSGTNDGTGWVYTSFDGGKSWKNQQLPGLTHETGAVGQFDAFDSAGDPAVAFGPHNTVAYANIAFNRNSSASGIIVSMSHDGGANWDAPSLVQFDNTADVFNDKEWVTIGPDGTIYVTWTQFRQTAGEYSGSPILISASHDGGLTWSSATFVSWRHPYSQGSIPHVAPDGTLYVVYEAASWPRYDKDVIVVSRSTDGIHFTDKQVGRVFDDRTCYPVNGDGRAVLSGMEFRLSSLPGFALDPVTGALAITWADDQGAGTCGYTTFLGGFIGTTSNQVKLVVGDGLRFSKARTITKGTADKAYPSVAAYGGNVVLSYYTRQWSQDGESLDFALASSTTKFTPERISDASSKPGVQFSGSFIGDYTAIALGSDGIAHPVWVDDRGDVSADAEFPGVQNQDLYTSAVALHG